MDIESIANKVICGTGHRPNKLAISYVEWDDNVEAKLTTQLIKLFSQYKPSKVISGMALGWDTVLAKAALAANIELELHVPCKNHSSKWPKKAQQVHLDICKQAVNVIVISDTYTKWCMQKRNESMVDSSDIVLAMWDGVKEGGTYNCIRYAEKVSKPIINLWNIIMETNTLPSFIDPNITLREEDHKYLISGEETNFISVTTLIHQFFPPFEPERIAKNLLKYPKYRGRTVKDILEEWEETNRVGSLVHWELEQYALSRREPTHPRALLGKAWLDKLFARKLYKFYPEVILYNKELNICGTTDLVLEEIATGHLHVMDYKCIRQLRFKSFDNEYGIHPITAQLMNCNFIVYTIQMSIYRYLLETFHNKTVHTQNLVHVREHDIKVYQCQYFKNIVEQMFALLPNKLPFSHTA